MKNKRLTARVMAVFAAVLLITALSVPAFAATSYTFYGTESGCAFGEFLIPEGKYIISSASEEENWISSLPIDIQYSAWDDGFICERLVTLSNGYDSLNLYVCILTDPYFITYWVNDQPFFAEGDSTEYSVEKFLYDGLSITFTPVYESPSLADYVTADTLPNVLNEIISLLPLVLGVLVGYIAIRKGISYLQSFLHNS